MPGYHGRCKLEGGRRPRAQPELFPRKIPARPQPSAAAEAPLAERMRPRELGEVLGQDHLVGEGRLLRQIASARRPDSLLLWGPPGSGKTTIARLLADALGLPSERLSAVLSGVKEVRSVLERAERRRAADGRPTVLFVDEIHRFNKAQQAALLAHVESGAIALLGATTENPSFEVIAPLLSRMRVLRLEALPREAVGQILDRALHDPERGLGGLSLELSADARAAILEHARGDARVALGVLEAAAHLAGGAAKTIGPEHVAEAAQRRPLLYDRDGDERYDLVSAFIKSMRGSDPDAALYYLVRMLEAGEDPLFLARRMVVFAAEDIGNADPRALPLAVAVKDAVHFVGLPEARIPLAQGATFLATAPKSHASLAALERATEAVRRHGPLAVPRRLRNAPTRLLRELGNGRGYRYPHDHPGHHVDEDYLPDELAGARFYTPDDEGEEAAIAERLRRWRGEG